MLPLADELPDSEHFSPSFKRQSDIEKDYCQPLLLKKDLLFFEAKENFVLKIDCSEIVSSVHLMAIIADNSVSQGLEGFF